MPPRPSGLLISMMSTQGPSPSAPVFTSLKIHPAPPPPVREQERKYPERGSPSFAAVPWPNPVQVLGLVMATLGLPTAAGAIRLAGAASAGTAMRALP